MPQKFQDTKEGRESKRRAEVFILILLGTIALGGVFLIFWAATGREGERIGPGPGTSIREMAEDPGRFDGRIVQVTGKVGRILGPASFSLEAAGLYQGPGILVVGVRPVAEGDEAASDGEGIFLQVSGPVRILRRENMEELGLRMGDSALNVWEGLPVILARDLARASWFEQTEGVGVVPEGGRAGGAAMGDPDAAISLGHVIENFLAYRGDTVTVDGFVVKIVSAEAFSMTAEDVPGNQTTLVIGAREGLVPALSPGGRVRVTGMVRRFDVRAFRRDLGRTLDAAAYGAWNQEPSIVASRIAPR